MDPAPALACLLIASCAYSAAGLWAVLRFRASARPEPLPPDRCPAVSILKPSAGAGSEFLACLRSHAQQDHPDFEVLVGAGADDREARDAVDRIQLEHPDLRITLIDCPEPAPGSNGKVAALSVLGEHARNAVWVISDADVRLPAKWLRTVCGELAEPGTGLVTCLYRAAPGRRSATRLEALWIDTQFSLQILLARWLQGVRFALGAASALRRETVEAVGGLDPLLHFAGDDYQMGARVAASGLGVRISAVAVSTHLPEEDGWKRVWQRQLRWSRTIRMQRPLGHAGLFVSFGSLWAALALIARPSALWQLAAAACALQVAAAAVARSQVRAEEPLRTLWLLPLRDLCAAAVWLWSYAGRGVQWAGRGMRLGRDGRIAE